MRKEFMAVCMGAFCLSALSDVSIDPNSVSFTTNNTRAVTVSYALSGDANAVVTFDLLTNGTSVGGAWLKYTSGAVCKIVSPGSHTFVWYPDSEEPVNLDWGDVTVKVTAWALDNPPPYMVADLVATNATSKIRRYYETPESLPGAGGITNIRYKTDCLVMRRIPAKDVQWCMGRTSGEGGNVVSGGEAQHYVTMTKDYYIGVYPLTWGQYRNLMSTAVDSAYKAAGSDLPVTNQTWSSVRGNTDASSAPTANSLIGHARTRLESNAIDFPTDEQWEYACRACCAAPFANGTTKDSTYEMGWYSDNSGSPNHTHPVGTKKPNAWGLYDMHGNVWEMCLDGWYTPTAESKVTESLHAPTGATKVTRGGCFRHNAATYARSAARLNRSATIQQYDQGFRLADEAVAR